MVNGVGWHASVTDWVRIALTVEDAVFAAACDRIVAHANRLQLETA